MRRSSLILTLCAAAHAHTHAQSNAAKWVEQLDSPSFVDRELAADELELDPSISLEDLEEQLEREDLSPEQRMRLYNVALQRFLSGERAAMGINLDDVSDAGMRIRGPQPGFDAEEKLQANDVISDINGNPIRSMRDLRLSIISRSAGEVVPVVVLRGMREMTIDIELGAWTALPGQRPLQRSELFDAWLFRSRSYTPLATPETIEDSAALIEWNEANQELPPQRPTQVRDAQGIPLRTRVVVGGEARPRPGSLARMRLDRPLNRSAQQRAADYPAMIKDNLISLEVQAVAVRERLRRTQVGLDELEKQGGRRQQLEHAQRQVESFQVELSELERQIERYRAELRDLGIQDP